MEKIVISGSVKLQDKVEYWIEKFKNYEILDYPRLILKGNYKEELSLIYKNFYSSIEKTDIFFLMNEEKNGIKGYIGTSGMSELTYAVILNLIHNKNIKIYILNMPDKSLSCYDEIKNFLDMGWIELYKRKSE